MMNNKIKVLFLLQNAWGDRKLPISFKPNEFNKSAKVCRKIIGKEIDLIFSNSTAVVTTTAKGNPGYDLEHVDRVLDLHKHYDFLLVSGKVAEKAFGLSKNKVLFEDKHLVIPHPASRNLSNEKINEIRLCVSTLLLRSKLKSRQHV